MKQWQLYLPRFLCKVSISVKSMICWTDKELYILQKRKLGKISVCCKSKEFSILGTKTLQIFSYMFVTLSKNKELFTLTWNGINASARCVFSTLVVLNTRLPDWLQCTQTKDDGEKRINTKTVTIFPKWNTNIKLLWQSWNYHFM